MRTQNKNNKKNPVTLFSILLCLYFFFFLFIGCPFFYPIEVVVQTEILSFLSIVVK